ncbi:MAG: carboxypeptidase-like regulatory domain-containing protein [Cyclobacteriaceae bacterium]
MMKSFFVKLFLLSSIAIKAQIISGVVLDSKTNQPLPYVHIGVPNKNMGVISRDNGKFEIDLSKADKDEELVFSMLGYTVVKKKISSLLSTKDLEIKLVEEVKQLKEVVVRNEKPKPIKLGRFKPSNTTMGQSMLKDFGCGNEWGLRIFNKDKKFWIDNVQFHMRFNTVDSILFRIQIYKVKDNMPGESILREETFVTSHNGQHWISKDLERQALVLDQDVIVAYEVVRVWYSKTSDNELFFTYGKGYEEGKVYSRASSLDSWKIGERAPAAIPVAMFLTVSEY